MIFQTVKLAGHRGKTSYDCPILFIIHYNVLLYEKVFKVYLPFISL